MNRMARVSLSALVGAGFGLTLASTAVAEPPREVTQQQLSEQTPALQVTGPGSGPTRAGKDTIVHADNVVSLDALRAAVGRDATHRPQLAAETASRPESGGR